MSVILQKSRKTGIKREQKTVALGSEMKLQKSPLKTVKAENNLWESVWEVGPGYQT